MAALNRSQTATGQGLKQNAAIDGTIFIILSILIVLSNATVLLLYRINPRIRSTKNLLLASLALSDFTAGMIVIPITLSCFQYPERSMCITSAVLFRFLAFSTISHILAIIYEKYISIIHPFYVVRMKHLRIISGFIWISCAIIAIIPLAWFLPGSTNDQAFVRKELAYIFVTFVLFFIGPFVMIVFAQVRMLLAISRSFTLSKSVPSLIPQSPTVENIPLSSGVRSAPKSHSDSILQESGAPTRASFSYRHNRKVLTAFALMLGTFTMCWFTWYLGIFLFYVDQEKFLAILKNLKYTFQALVFLPSLINPWLYTYYKPDFRQALQAFLKTTLKALCH